jgi:hypothetical protein
LEQADPAYDKSEDKQSQGQIDTTAGKLEIHFSNQSVPSVVLNGLG